LHSILSISYTTPVPPPSILCAHLELENGYISLNAVTEGKIAAFVCQEGYNLKGKETLTCEQSGQWSGDVPKCISELTIKYVAYSFLHLKPQ